MSILSYIFRLFKKSATVFTSSGPAGIVLKTLGFFRKSSENRRLAKEYSAWKEKITVNRSLFSNEKLIVAFAVSDTGENVTQGDYFSAIELGSQLQKLGWEVKYLSEKKDEWYKPDQSVDIIIALIESFDPRKYNLYSRHTIKIAWMRNWFGKWIEKPYFENYDLHFVSSDKASEFIHLKTATDCHTLPLATNPDRFGGSDSQDIHEHYRSDYCFTGSYWNDRREIIDFLNPAEVGKYRFAVYGANWDKVPEFKPYYRGFIKYADIPKVYSNTKIVVDDANRATRPFGSVNSRVFDAIASGALVVTNCEIGNEEMFDSLIPVYSNSEELAEKLRYYLEHEDERTELVKTLKEIVLKKNTYADRANYFKKVVVNWINKFSNST